MYTPKSPGSVLVIGKIASIMLVAVAVGVRCQKKAIYLERFTGN